jgi:glycosyltransferase involved in cell wall biosynthesis
MAINICKLLGLKYWVILHGLDLIELQKKNQGKLESFLNGASGFICNSKATRKLLYKLFPSHKSKPVSIVYPGFDKGFLELITSKISNNNFLNKNGLKEKKVVCTIARLVKRKGIDIAIEGLAKFLHNNKEWIYVIAGSGPELSMLKKRASELDLDERIVFTGFLSVEEKFNLLSYSSVFIMPNHLNNNSDFEGFGISFVEAQFFENWIIAGKSGGVVEAVDSETGHFVDFEVDLDPVEQISILIEKISTYSSSNKKGKQFVLDHFEMECMSNQVQNVDFG